MTNPGLYTNRDNEPHENFVYQNLRSSRMENSQRDILGERIRLLAHQLDISQVGDSVRSPEVPNQEDSNSMPALPNHNWAAGPSARSPTRMDQSHVIAPHDRTIEESELILIKPLEKRVIDERARKVKKCGNAEQQWYATERHKTPLVDLTAEVDQPVRIQKTKKRMMTIEDLEDDPMDEPDTIQSDHSIQGSDSEWNEPRNRPPPTANKRRPYRHVPSPTHYRRRRRRKKKRNESEASTQETLEENSSSRADSEGDSSDDDSSDDQSDESSEEAEDTEEVDTSFENAQPGPSRSKPIRSSNRTPQKKSRRINSSVDEDEDDEDFDEEPVKQSLSRRISRERTSRRSTPSKNSTRNSSKTVDTAKRNLNNQPSSLIPTFQLIDSLDEQSADQQPAEIDGVSWIKHLTSLRTPFIPQINDEVFYSPGAHAKYCEEFESKVGRLRVNERVPKEINKQNLLERLILCDVSSIEGML